MGDAVFHGRCQTGWLLEGAQSDIKLTLKEGTSSVVVQMTYGLKPPKT